MAHNLYYVKIYSADILPITLVSALVQLAGSGDLPSRPTVPYVLKTTVRSLLRTLTRIPLRGRHRLADQVGLWAASDTTEVIRINGVRIELDHRVRQHRMMYYGLYEENIFNFLRRYLKPGMVVFDPGANMGYFAAQCIGLVGAEGIVHSFEPSRTANAQMRRMNDLRGFATWKLWDLALTDHTGEHTFYDTPRVMLRGFACLEGTYDPTDKIPYPVQVTTLDAFCAEQDIERIDFLKLDIEGSELPALKGAERLLQEGRIGCVMVETTLVERTRDLTQQIDDLMRNAGFSSFHASRDGRTRPVVVMTHSTFREDVLWLKR